MATLQDYEAVAPIVTGLGVTQAQIETKLASVAAPVEPQPEPTVTKAKVVAIFDAIVADRLEADGKKLRQLATDNDLTVAQVKNIVKELRAMNSVYQQSLQA